MNYLNAIHICTRGDAGGKCLTSPLSTGSLEWLLRLRVGQVSTPTTSVCFGGRKSHHS